MSTPHPTAHLARRGARVLLVNATERVLLLRGADPAQPGVRYWFTVGGGLDPGESPVQGAARELHEETGLLVPPSALGAPVWHEVAEFPFDGRWYRQEQDFFLLRVAEWQVSRAGWDEVERRTVDAVRWWSVPELEMTDETYYPVGLAALLRGLLAGGEA
ncbi:MAG: NUDIX hydrolase [Micromonosporaceae bacterium]